MHRRPPFSAYIIDTIGITVLPSSTVQSGTPVEIICKAKVSHDNIPNLTYTFELRRDDVAIFSSTVTKDSATYEILPARVADSGSYECRVTVKEKSRTSFSQKLEVTGLQTPTLYLDKTTFYAGDDFKATCSAPEERGSFIFRFFQRFRNEEPQQMKQVAPIGNFSETTLILRQTGDYFLYCSYEINLVSGTRRSNRSNEIHVNVRVLQITPVMNVLPSPNVFEGELLEVVCKVLTSVENVEVFLTRDGSVLKKALVSLSHRFRVHEGDSGEVTCKAERGNVQKETYQVIRVKELFSKPHLAVNPVEIFEGEKFKLTCSATVYVPERLSNETVQLYIYKDNVKLTSSGTYISVANPYKNGNYTCKAYAVSQGHSILKQSQTLVVKAKVLVSEPVLSVVGGTLVLGKSFQLLCHSDRGTLPIIYNLHGPNKLNEQRVVSKPGEQAIFNSSAIFKSSDLNNFICHAKNSLNSPSMVGNGRQLLHSTNIIEPVLNPVLTIVPRTGYVSEGQDVKLTCSVEKGTLPIRYTWYHIGKKGALISQTSKELQGTYFIRSVRGEDKGEYYCETNNPANETKQSAAVMIIVKMAGWKKGLIAVFCILLILALVLVIALKTRLLQFKRKGTGKLLVKSAGTKVERLSLTQAEVNEAANATPGMMGKSVWSERVSGSESDDQNSEAAAEPQYTNVQTRQADPNRAPVKKGIDTEYSKMRTSKQGFPEQADGHGSVEYAQLNRETDHHTDHGIHVDHSVQDDHRDEVDSVVVDSVVVDSVVVDSVVVDSVDTSTADHGE
ncbi:platelet endothelial cell adhesion molecule isoform X2 [Lates calcarifer]|uniref:Platelet endothelial cell adhesion molecule n=1 Tax=Lates calcarifer TaxID=8187 RepID=A0AAJ8BCD2_LATCA|nr:platelet endothelial cell adhesion molecule isoform X2 [Lates calcarifer]